MTAIVLLAITQAILIPIVFKVIKTNNKVLSLFGYLPISEIKNLLYQCESFINEFLTKDGNNDSNLEMNPKQEIEIEAEDEME